MGSDFLSYVECHQKVCKKKKKQHDKLFNAEMMNPNSKCKRQTKRLQSKYDPVFLQEQQMRLQKTLKRAYINHNKYDKDILKLKNTMDPKLIADKDFIKALTCKKGLDKAALTRDKCIRNKCGPVPKMKGGKRTRRRKKRRTGKGTVVSRR